MLNTTQKVGHFIGIRLEATKTQRDAIGALITVETADRAYAHQRVAGDGYFASNEQQIIAGLNKADIVTRLIIEWPSGDRQEFKNLKVDRHFMFVEGDDTAHELPLRPASN